MSRLFVLPAARSLQAFLELVLALANQAVTDIGSVNGILDAVSTILAVDVDPTGIAADVAVRAQQLLGTALEL